jgi:predicted amidohydrolase
MRTFATIIVMLAAAAWGGEGTFRAGCLEYSGHTGKKDSEVKMQVLYEGLERGLAKQAKTGAPLDLIVTGETPTLMGSEETMDKMAQAIPGPRTEKLGAIAAAHKVWLVADLLEWEAAGEKPKVYNTQVVFDREGKIVATYRKIILPPEEVEHGISAGSKSVVIDTEFGRMGLITCWEAQFPDRVAELMRLRPHFVVHPTAGDFQELLPYIARQYKVWFASASWSGPSIVVGPDGKILATELYNGGEPSEMKVAVAKIPRGQGNDRGLGSEARGQWQQRQARQRQWMPSLTGMVLRAAQGHGTGSFSECCFPGFRVQRT